MPSVSVREKLCLSNAPKSLLPRQTLSLSLSLSLSSSLLSLLLPIFLHSSLPVVLLHSPPPPSSCFPFFSLPNHMFIRSHLHPLPISFFLSPSLPLSVSLLAQGTMWV